jgi:hypothetical protein
MAQGINTAHHVWHKGFVGMNWKMCCLNGGEMTFPDAIPTWASDRISNK